MRLSPQTYEKIQRFLLAHEQNQISITFMSNEWRRRRPPGVDRLPPIRVKLDCFNGEDWQGFQAVCPLNRVNTCVRVLINHYRARSKA